MKIIIRVDAYLEIALGHLNRCVNLGASLLMSGHEVVFVCYKDSATKKILDQLKDS